MTEHAIEREKLLVMDVTDKGVISKIHKKHLQVDKNERLKYVLHKSENQMAYKL